jgi:hypothetical protein
MRGQSLLAGQALGPGPQPDTTSVQVGNQHLIVPGRFTGKVRLLIRPDDADDEVQRASRVR